MEDRKLRARIISILRRAWMRDWTRSEALRKARVDRGIYRCALCSRDKLYKRKEINVDHIIPVVMYGEDAKNDLESICIRLFCSVDGLRILCIDHHQEITNIQREKRAKRK